MDRVSSHGGSLDRMRRSRRLTTRSRTPARATSVPAVSSLTSAHSGTTFQRAWKRPASRASRRCCRSCPGLWPAVRPKGTSSTSQRTRPSIARQGAEKHHLIGNNMLRPFDGRIELDTRWQTELNVADQRAVLEWPATSLNVWATRVSSTSGRSATARTRSGWQHRRQGLAATGGGARAGVARCPPAAAARLLVPSRQARNP
jgi:hypothetical protein